MTSVLNQASRVSRFLGRLGKKAPFTFCDAPDPRQAGKVVHPISSIISTMLMCLVSNAPTLRDAERHSNLPNPLNGGRINPISDTSLARMAAKLDPDYLLGKLCGQVRHMERAKMLKPAGLPCGMVAIDGKNLATLKHDGNGTGHHRSAESTDKWRHQAPEGEYFLFPALRATLASAAQTPCIYQLPLPPGKGEAAMVPDLLDGLNKEYGRSGLIEVVSGDAGLTSLSNAEYIVSAGYTYFLGLKGNQKALHEAAQVVLYNLVETTSPQAETDWEPRGNGKIRRQLWRSTKLRDFESCAGEWHHLEQVILARQITKGPNGKQTIEDRFFMTSAEWTRFTPTEILALVRAHWAVEATFNSLDLQWFEDSGIWCTSGISVLALGLLRMMAYNIAQHLRRCHLRRCYLEEKPDKPMAWRELFELARTACIFMANPELMSTS